MATAAEIRSKEKARVQTGVMKGLGRLLIFTPTRTTDDGMRWSQVDVKDLARLPLGVDAKTRLSKKARQTKVVLESKDPDTDSFVAQIFARVEEGVAKDDLDEIINCQVEESNVEVMRGLPDNQKYRAKAYKRLTRFYPEGIYAGFTYPHMGQGETYRLVSLTGKRGEAAEISVNDSNGGDVDSDDEVEVEDEEQEDIETEEDDDDDEDEEGIAPLEPDSQVITTQGIPEASLRIPRRTTPVLARKSVPPAATPGKGSPKKTPKSSGKKKASTPPAVSAQKPRKSSEKKHKGHMPAEDSEEPSASILESAVTTPKSSKSPRKKSSSKKKKNRADTSPKPSTSKARDEVLMDPFKGVPSFLDSSPNGSKGSKGSKAKKSLFKAPEAPRKSRSRKPTMESTEPEDQESQDRRRNNVEPDDEEDFIDGIGTSQYEKERKRKKGREGSADSITNKEAPPQKKQTCKDPDGCKCDDMTRANMRRQLSQDKEGHLRENVRYLDYRAIMDKLNEVRAITQNNRTVLKAVDARTACLEQFAQKAAIANAAQEAVKNDKGILEAPWANVGKIAEVFTDENKKEALFRFLKTLPQKATHFPRDVVRELMAPHMRKRVYIKRPPRHNSRGIFILGQEYVVFPDTFNDFISTYMHNHVAGFASYEEASDKWTSYFNDARKKEKAKQNNFFRQSRNVEKDIFHLCWRDTQCELFVLDEPAPLEEPVEDSLKPAFSALQDRYMIRWKPIVQRAFDANWPNGKPAEKLLTAWNM